MQYSPLQVKVVEREKEIEIQEQEIQRKERELDSKVSSKQLRNRNQN